MKIRSLIAEDYPAVQEIYEQGLATGNASFASTSPDWIDWDKNHVKNCRLVATENGHVLGWAALTSISDRCVYAGVAEVSIYIATEARGKGIGKKLLQAVIAESEQSGFWTLEARIFPENAASLRIHEECGFRLVGRREKIGQMNGIWRDILLLERRSMN